MRDAVARSRDLWPAREDYRLLRRTWRKDLVAGVTVGIVALPLALGFGVSSGLTAEQGLITAIIAGLLAAVFGGSNVQVSGPTGAMVVVLVPIVAAHGVGAIAAVTLLAGLMVMATGLLRLGKVVSIIPWPVIEGFTLGIA
ncbi:MAG: SulP family inorganic anion transporter, partial [Dermabacteraceae bacterium]